MKVLKVGLWTMTKTRKVMENKQLEEGQLKDDISRLIFRVFLFVTQVGNDPAKSVVNEIG